MCSWSDKRLFQTGQMYTACSTMPLSFTAIFRQIAGKPDCCVCVGGGGREGVEWAGGGEEEVNCCMSCENLSEVSNGTTSYQCY